MRKLKFFFLLNRKNRAKNVILFLVFFMAGMIVSASLLIQRNNTLFYESQVLKLAEGNLGIESNQLLKEFQLISDNVNSVLNVLAIASVMIAVWGGITLLFFKDISMQKTFVVCKIYGMKQQDIIYKALVDFLQYGVLAGITGTAAGFGLFVILVQKLCGVAHVISIISFDTLRVFLFVTLLLGIISVFSSLITGFFVYEKPEANILYERNIRFSCKKTIYAAILGFGLLLILLRSTFEKAEYIKWMLGILIIVVGMSGSIFYFVFSAGARKHRNKRALSGLSDLSYRFLCTRYKRDAILAATISVGAILICFIMNLEFNFSGILKNSYRDNMGYSVVVRADTYKDGAHIKDLLDEKGFTYTTLSSKLMDYEELQGCGGMEGKFWMAVVGQRTDHNEHFHVSSGSFRAENYFVSRFQLQEGKGYDILGKHLIFENKLSDNQGLSLINYNVLVNEEDWRYVIDDTWSRVFLMDVTTKEEELLTRLLMDEPCSVETATQIVDELNKIMKDYLLVVSVVGVMLTLVTGTFFYSMIQNDLLERTKELFLYQIYGASRKKAVRVIFMEYIWIAVTASFSVVFVVMALGELYFLYMLQRHYPLSIVVVVLTTVLVSGFVFLCCIIAEKITYKGRNIGLIRDE